MLKIFKYLGKVEWALILLSVGFIVLSVWLDLEMPGFMENITNHLQNPESDVSDVWREGAWMLGFALLSMAVMMITGFLAARMATKFAKDLRERLFNKVLDFSAAEINGFSIPSLITRSTNDITQVQDMFTMGFQTMLRSPILAVWAIIKIFDVGFEFSLATMVAVGIMLVLIAFLVIFALPKIKIVQDLTDNLNRVTREHLTGIRVVKAYNAKDYEEEKFADANEVLMRTNLSLNRMMATLWPVVWFILQMLPLAIYLIGAYLINDADMMERGYLFSNMMVFTSYAMMVIMAFLMMSMTFVMLPRAVVSARRVNEVLSTPFSLTYPESDVKADGEASGAAISFDGVSFKYPNAADYVLEDISFEVNKGETVAFIGATGSGKSSIVNLIARFYDTTEGTVEINGMNVKNYTKKSLNKIVSYALQKTVLFSGNVLSNVAFGEKDTNIEAVKEAVEIAQGKDFVEKMEDTYEADITQGGTNVSGGQKQRLGIARAIFKKPEIFIFDDSFSALDYKTDRKLRTALSSDLSGATKVIVAQRVATIMGADKIFVLDEGRIVDTGTHDELMKSSDIYQEIAYSQFGKEELGHE